MRLAATCLLAIGLGWALAGCGQDSGSGEVASGPAAKPAAGQAGSGSAAGGGSGAAPAAGSGGGMAAQKSPTASSCLDLVKAAHFSEALDPCTRAVREAPHDLELSAALKKAQAGVAAAAAKAGEAATAAAKDAEDTAAAAGKEMDSMGKSASDAMKDAAGSM